MWIRTCIHLHNRGTFFTMRPGRWAASWHQASEDWRKVGAPGVQTLVVMAADGRREFPLETVGSTCRIRWGWGGGGV